ncbi:hypothetical protein Tco_1268453 [Tanacetum coccineum]
MNYEVAPQCCIPLRSEFLGCYTDTDSEEGPSYDSAFIIDVQQPLTSFMNMLFSESDHEQTYHEQPKIINSTIGDDQINNDIIFDDPNVEVNDAKDEDQYLDDILKLKAKVKKNENVVVKMSKFVQAMFMLGPKPFSFHESKLKHGLGYENPYTLKQAIFKNPKLYDASYLHSLNVHANFHDTEEILKDATKSQIKMNNKLKDPITIEKKKNFLPINYGKLNDLYETFVPQVELSLE